jgi:hypothetical protein
VGQYSFGSARIVASNEYPVPGFYHHCHGLETILYVLTLQARCQTLLFPSYFRITQYLEWPFRADLATIIGSLTWRFRSPTAEAAAADGIKLRMELEGLYGASFVDWETVAASWAKRTVGSRLLLFAARRYLSAAQGAEKREDRAELIELVTLPKEIKAALATPPTTAEEPSSKPWGEFVDAALVAELEMVSYGERPVLLGELRAGLSKAAEEAGPDTALGRWLFARRDVLPGEDLPENTGYLPV